MGRATQELYSPPWIEMEIQPFGSIEEIISQEIMHQYD